MAARSIMRLDHRQTGKARRREDMATTEKETAGALDTDLIQLDAFLRSDKAPPECMMLSDLDGFLTGIAVGPELILPSEWLPVVWGEEAATFANETQARIVLAAIMGHYDQILRQIGECAPQPILWRTSDGTTIASGWAKGFAHAIALRPNLWKQLATSEAAVLLTPIMLLCSDEENGRSARLDLSPEEMIKTMEEAADAIPATILAISAYWRMEASKETRRASNLQTALKAGRNDPCPCGSGKKFKKCCGA